MNEHGTFCWNELTTGEVEKAKRFYETTLGWRFEAMPMASGGTYWIAKTGDRPAGGIFDTTRTDMADAGEFWFAYIAVDDVDARVRKAKDAGATIVREPFDIPGVGRIAILRQPGGGMIGWMTPAPQS
jgi:predicted enzyme related to lactoylglutathione lyase